MIHVLLFVGLVGLSVQDIGFSGVWERDVERSDDPREKMQAAMEQMREQMGRRGGGGCRAALVRLGRAARTFGGGAAEVVALQVIDAVAA